MKYSGTLESATQAGKGVKVVIKTERGGWTLRAYRDAAKRIQGMSTGSEIRFDASKQSGNDGNDWWRMDAVQGSGPSQSGANEPAPQGHEKRLFIQNCLVSVLSRPEATPDDVFSFGTFLADFYDTKILGKILRQESPGAPPDDDGPPPFDDYDGPPY